MNYVIIGNGPAGVHAALSIRQRDPEGEITFISKEDNAPYSRIMIPELLSKEIEEASLYYLGTDFYERYGIIRKLGETVTGIEAAGKTVLLESGESVPFDKLLIASGSSPALPLFAKNPPEGVFSLWNKTDAEKISALPDKDADPAVIVGGGLVGLLAARALLIRGRSVTVIESQKQLMSAQLDAPAADILARAAEKAGVNVMCGVNVEAFETSSGGKLAGVITDRGRLPAKLALIAVGVKPNIAFTAGCGFNTAHGLVVNDEMRTNIPDIFAAGDAACAPGILEGTNVIRPLWLCAVKQGKTAGANMAGGARRGDTVRYDTVRCDGSVAMNSIDLFGLSVISMGILGGKDFEEVIIRPPQKGVYQKLLFRGEKLMGFILTGDVREAGILASKLGQAPGNRAFSPFRQAG